jgi:hypothetical protein
VGAPKPIASCALTVGDMAPNKDGTPHEIFDHTPACRRPARASWNSC